MDGPSAWTELMTPKIQHSDPSFPPSYIRRFLRPEPEGTAQSYRLKYAEEYYNLK